MTAHEIDKQIELAEDNQLTPAQFIALIRELAIYRQMALRLERAVHDLVKKLEAVDLEAEDIDNQINLRLKAEQELEKIKGKA